MASEDVEAGSKRIAHCADEIPWSRDISVKTRMIGMSVPIEDMPRNVVEHVQGIGGSSRQIRAQCALPKRLASARDRFLSQAAVMIDDHVDDAVAKLAHSVGRECQGCSHGRSSYKYAPAVTCVMVGWPSSSALIAKRITSLSQSTCLTHGR
jgi:hypothetical protein